MSQASGVRLTVDEILTNSEGVKIAVLEADDGGTVTIPLHLLPEGIDVDDVLTARFEPEPDETTRRRLSIADLQRRLFGEE